AMALNPLAPVTDYQSMLNRIFWFTSAAALGAVWLLRTHLPALDAVLVKVDLEVQTGAGKLLPVPGGYLLPALAVGLIARVFRIHSQLGHWLGIRERFDIDVILTELARRVGIDVDSVTEEQWLEHRHDLMRQTFYRFASSNSPQIDEHLIHQALDLWSWFWIGLEATLLFVLTGLALVAVNARDAGLVTIGGTVLLAAAGLPSVRNQCKHYAIAQVRAILSDPAREELVRQAFAPLNASRSPWQRVA
ncbi:MAG: hypothetical protein SH868_03860, partial [Bythopirellula sp.]|nr:hypothetical protein [Bythopirellula sp.]